MCQAVAWVGCLSAGASTSCAPKPGPEGTEYLNGSRPLDLFSLAGKVAFITGSGGGIGRVLAQAIGETGAAIALHDRTVDQMGEAGDLLRETGVTFEAFTADLTDIDACRGLVANVVSRFGRLDILVNCAAVNKREPVDDVLPETFDWIVAVNLRAPFFLSQAARRVMRAQGGGKIINVTSINAQFALDTVAVYGLTKGAMRQMTAEMAVEFAPDNIQVNALTPGFVVTPLSEQSLWGDPRKRAWILDRVPAGRPGLPGDMIGAILFMASRASDFMTGQSIVVDGGFTAGGSWEYQGARAVDAGPSTRGTGHRQP